MEWIDVVESVTCGKITHILKMFSRRNNVYRVSVTFPDRTSKNYVVKDRILGTAIEEAYLLTLLKVGGVEVPRVFWNDNRIIVLEYLDGVLLTDMVLDAQASAGGNQWVEVLARWLFSLHSFMKIEDGHCLCMPDLNLRNFIYKDGNFLGYDFEEMLVDRPERDLGGLCAHIFNNDPVFAEYKYDIVKKLIHCYLVLAKKSLSDICINLDLVNRSFIREMQVVMERRRVFGRGANLWGPRS